MIYLSQIILALLGCHAGLAVSDAVTSLANDGSITKTLCDAYGNTTIGDYSFYSNAWGALRGEGQQCSQITSRPGMPLSWTTSMNWTARANKVKSFPMVQSSSFQCKPLSEIDSLKTTWAWKYSGDELRANVAYDTFLGSKCAGNETYEVMIWLGVYGNISPLCDCGYPSTGPIATDTPTIAGTKFNLILGTGNVNEPIRVFSFVAAERADNFKGDLMDFYRYLAKFQNLNLRTMHLMNVQSGTEVFTAKNATFSTSAFNLTQT